MVGTPWREVGAQLAGRLDPQTGTPNCRRYSRKRDHLFGLVLSPATREASSLVGVVLSESGHDGSTSIPLLATFRRASRPLPG